MSRYSYSCFRADGNGVKQFGITFWGNSVRVGLQLNFWVWDLLFMRERK